MKSGLRYIGRGRFRPGIPTTDLTPSDLARLAGADGPDRLRARLIASGLYAPAKPAKEG